MLHSKVRCPISNFFKKNKQLEFGKGLFGRLLLFAGSLWSFLVV